MLVNDLGEVTGYGWAWLRMMNTKGQDFSVQKYSGDSPHRDIDRYWVNCDTTGACRWVAIKLRCVSGNDEHGHY